MIFIKKKKFNLINIVIFTLLSILTLLLIYTHYKSYYFFNSTRLNQYIVYYYMFLGGIIFFSILIFLNSEIKKNTILFIFTLTMLIYTSEILVRFFFKDIDKDPPKINKEIRENRAKIILKKYGKVIDTRSQLEVKQSLKKKGVDVSLLVTPYRMLATDGIKFLKDGSDNASNADRIYPLSGISKKLYLGGAESGEYKFYTTDRYGFNNLDKDWDKDIHITLIGDSFVHGGYLNFENNFTGVLKRISEQAVLGLGQPNNGPMLELATLKEYALKIDPEIILWMYYEGNDLIELADEKNSKTLNKYLSKGFEQNLINNQINIERSYSRFVSEKINELELKDKDVRSKAFSLDQKKNTTLISTIKLQKIRKILFTSQFSRFKEDEIKNSTSHLEDVLIEAKREINLLGSKFYFVYLPSSTRYLKDYNYSLKRNKYFREEVINIVNKLNIELIDIHDILFKDNPNPLSFYHFSMHSHYNKKAVEQISLEIYKQINN
jgi:hypothetical protein